MTVGASTLLDPLDDEYGDDRFGAVVNVALALLSDMAIMVIFFEKFPRKKLMKINAEVDRLYFDSFKDVKVQQEKSLIYLIFG